MAHIRYTATISAQEALLQMWAVRSAVALGVDAVRVMDGAVVSDEARAAASVLRMPLLEGAPPEGECIVRVGGESLPSPEYLRALLPPGECNLSSRALEHVFATWEPEESARLPVELYANALRRYRVPSRFEQGVLLTQRVHAETAIEQLESARFGEHSGEVEIPLVGSEVLRSTLDPDGGWRVAQRWLREALRPATILGRYDAERGRVRIWGSTRRAEPLRAWTHWRVVRTDGMLLDEGGEAFALEGEGFREVESIPLAGLLREYSPYEMLVWMTLETDEGAVLSRRWLPFCAPKHLSLVNPELSIEVEPIPARSAKGSPEWRHHFRMLFPEHDDEDETRRSGGHWFRITLTALAPALCVELSAPGLGGIHFGENSLALETESPREILVRSARPLTLKAFRAALRIESLFDLASEDR